MDINVKITEQLTDLLKQHGIHIAPEIQNDITKILNEYAIIHRENKKRPNLDRRIEQFLVVKRLDGFAERTLGNYRITLNLFAKQTEKNTAQIQTDDIREYIVYLTTQRELKDSSLCTHINTLRSFFSWLLTEGLIRKNPMLKIKTKKLDKRNARHALTPEEMERLRDACQTYRERAVLELYYSTGCRLSEIADASLADINLQERSLCVKGKGGKMRTVYFSSRAKYMLSEYLGVRSGNSDGLFCGSKQPMLRLGARAIQKIVREIGERASLPRRVHPHLLRHTFATDLINAGMDITVLQTLLGHNEPSTTLIYAEISPLTTRRAYDRVVA